MKLKTSVNLHALYLCYFGLREPLVQTQVLPYLRQLQKCNIKISLLTFEPSLKEKWNKDEISKQKRELADEGIDWYCLPYHKRPSVPATAFDIASGARFARKMIREKGVNVLHARSHVPAMMGAIAKTLSVGIKVKLLFDIRGFMPEEYTDAGVWQANGRLYRNVKKIEKWLLAKSDAFVVLTEKAREILFPESAENGFDLAGRPIAVIPCCVDLRKFESANDAARREIREKLQIANRLVIIYVGALGGWYLTNEMADLMAVAKEQNPQVFALILTQSSIELIAPLLRTRGFAETDFLVTKVSPQEIPRYLSAADVALSFIKPCFSKLSSSPTKIAEYLASGLPVISNGGVGDVAEIIEADEVGVVIGDFNQKEYLMALQKIEILSGEENFAERCRQSARKRFDLETIGGEKYHLLYRNLFKNMD
jgi:glycosyltransferase involved in cell wall biosynthesis